MPTPDMVYIQECRALKLYSLDKQLLWNKCVLMQKVVYSNAPQSLKDFMIPSESLHLYVLPRAKIDIFRTSFSFSLLLLQLWLLFLAWNSVPFLSQVLNAYRYIQKESISEFYQFTLMRSIPAILFVVCCFCCRRCCFTSL